jgi:hypothetical protein
MKRLAAILRAASIAIAASLASIPSNADACSFETRKLTKAQIASEAEQAFQRATLVVDGEVVMPMTLGPDWKPGLVPAARIRVIKTWKGKADGDHITVVYLDSCDINLEQQGQKVRVLLSGESVFRTDQQMNGGTGGDQVTFNAAIDGLIGNARPANFASFPGEELPPPGQ